jgi:hypothetical protein
MSLSGDDEAELGRFFEKLSAGLIRPHPAVPGSR